MNMKMDDDEADKVLSNQAIDRALIKAYEATNRKFENYLLRDKQLKDGIDIIRKSLDETPSEYVKVLYVRSGPAIYPRGKSNPSVYKKLEADVANLLGECNIEADWTEYITQYIITDGKPEIPVFASPKTISIASIENGEVLLRLKPGLRRKDYINAWNQLLPILGKPNSLLKPITFADENMKMLALHEEEKLSHAQIAKIYYANDRDPKQARDKVKKRIKRERDRLRGGDK
jgi:hypothetical protein